MEKFQRVIRILLRNNVWIFYPVSFKFLFLSGSPQFKDQWHLILIIFYPLSTLCNWRCQKYILRRIKPCFVHSNEVLLEFFNALFYLIPSPDMLSTEMLTQGSTQDGCFHVAKCQMMSEVKEWDFFFFFFLVNNDNYVLNKLMSLLTLVKMTSPSSRIRGNIEFMILSHFFPCWLWIKPSNSELF